METASQLSRHIVHQCLYLCVLQRAYRRSGRGHDTPCRVVHSAQQQRLARRALRCVAASGGCVSKRIPSHGQTQI